MNQKTSLPLHVIWEHLPDRDYAEHLRRVFEILFSDAQDLFDETPQNAQDESAAQGPAAPTQ
jgi:hypothetical protein